MGEEFSRVISLCRLSAPTRGSDRPVERTGGETRCQAYQTLYGEAPCGSRESTRATRNGVYFHNAIDTRNIRWLTLAHNRSKDAVSIGRDQLSRPCCSAVRKGYHKLTGERELTDMGSNSCSIPIDAYLEKGTLPCFSKKSPEHRATRLHGNGEAIFQ